MPSYTLDPPCIRARSSLNSLHQSPEYPLSSKHLITSPPINIAKTPEKAIKTVRVHGFVDPLLNSNPCWSKIRLVPGVSNMWIPVHSFKIIHGHRLESAKSDPKCDIRSAPPKRVSGSPELIIYQNTSRSSHLPDPPPSNLRHNRSHHLHPASSKPDINQVNGHLSSVPPIRGEAPRATRKSHVQHTHSPGRHCIARAQYLLRYDDITHTTVL